MKLNILPIPQYEYMCSAKAIAVLDRFYSDQFGYPPIHSNKRFIGSGFISLREMTKEIGSAQGELLEIEMLVTMLSKIGYSGEVIEFKSFDKFKEIILQNIAAGNPLIIAYAAKREHSIYLGAPVKFNGSNAHTAIISGLDSKTDQVSLVHWGRYLTIPLQKLYDSNCTLPTQRDQQFYFSVKEKNHKKKYELLEEKELDSNVTPTLFKSTLKPKDGTGFQHKLVAVTNIPKKEIMLNIRKKILSEKINLDYILKNLRNIIGEDKSSLFENINSKYKQIIQELFKIFMLDGNITFFINVIGKLNSIYLTGLKKIEIITETQIYELTVFFKRVKWEIEQRLSDRDPEEKKQIYDQNLLATYKKLFLLEELEINDFDQASLTLYIMSGTILDGLNASYNTINTKTLNDRLSFENTKYKIVFNLPRKIAENHPHLEEVLSIIAKCSFPIEIEFKDKSSADIIQEKIEKNRKEISDSSDFLKKYDENFFNNLSRSLNLDISENPANQQSYLELKPTSSFDR